MILPRPLTGKDANFCTTGRKTLYVGCGEWGFRNLPLREHFEIACDFGFRVLEFGIGGNRIGKLSDDPSDMEMGYLAALREEFAIETPFCCLESNFTLPDPQQHREMLRKIRRQLRVAARCSATHVRLHAGFTPLAEMTEDLWRQLFSALELCQLDADQLGLQLALETQGCKQQGALGGVTHFPTLSTDAEALQRLLANMPSRIGINYDPGNIKAAEGNSRRLHLSLLDSRINYCHLKDCRRKGTGWEVCGVGDDDLDFAQLISQMSYDGVYLIEYEPVNDVREGIRRSLEALQQTFDLVLDGADSCG